MIKNLWLVAALGVISLIFWLKTKLWLNDPTNWQNTGLWLWPVLGLIVLAALLALSLLLIVPRLLRLLTAALPLVLFLAVFGVHYLLLAGTALALVLNGLAGGNIQTEKNSRIKLRLAGMLRGGIYRILTAIFILISFAYFLTPGVQVSAKNKTLPPDIERIVQVIVGNYAGREAEAQNPRLIAQVSQEVIHRMNTWLQPYFQYFPPLLAFSLFLFLQGLSFIFLRLATVFSSLIFLMLKSFKIITIQKVSKEAEVIVF